MRKIYLHYTDLTQFRAWYAGKRSRYATATAVRIVGDNLIAAHYLGRKLYLMNFEGEVISELSTDYETDLLDYRNGLVACSNLSDERISIYRLKGIEFIFIKFVHVPRSNLHGIRFKDDNTIAVTTKKSIVLVNIDTEEIRELVIESVQQPKDICFYKDTFIYPTSSTHVTDQPYLVPPKRSSLKMSGPVDENGFLGIDMVLTDGQPDAICMRGDEGFVTMQDSDSICHFRVADYHIEVIEYIPGFNFPHGIDCDEKRIVVTNYGDNSISILE